MGLEPTTFCVQSHKVPVQSVFSSAIAYQLSWTLAVRRRTPRNRFGRPDANRIDTSLIPDRVVIERSAKSRHSTPLRRASRPFDQESQPSAFAQ